MAAFVAKFVGKKILGETVENKFGKEVSVAPEETRLFERNLQYVLTNRILGSLL